MGFLDRVVRDTEREISRSEYLAGIGARPSAPRPSLKRAVAAAGSSGAVLVEFKRFSPGSESPALPSRSASDFVAATHDGGVAGYSCIATGSEFHGSPGDVAAVVRSTPLPVLFKDFVIDPVQLDAAARCGAAAVLLIARLEAAGLLHRPLPELAAEARARGLEVLLEFHDKAELSLARGVAADVYGVNARDLDSLRIDHAAAEATIRAARELRPMLGLSGIATPADAARFWELGVDGILVGSSVARSSNPRALVASLHRPAMGAPP